MKDWVRETQAVIVSKDTGDITEQQFQTRILVQIAKLLAELVQSDEASRL